MDYNNMGYKIRVMIGGEVYEAMVTMRPARVYSSESYLDLVVDIGKTLNKTWKDLGYDCFEDMIDDIAKRHREDEELKLTPDEIKWLKEMYKLNCDLRFDGILTRRWGWLI